MKMILWLLLTPPSYDVFDDYEYELNEISHWMPLPAPAEMGE